MAFNLWGCFCMIWTHPFISCVVLLLFTPPFFPIVKFFSPLLISTALCVLALVSMNAGDSSEHEGNTDQQYRGQRQWEVQEIGEDPWKPHEETWKDWLRKVEDKAQRRMEIWFSQESWKSGLIDWTTVTSTPLLLAISRSKDIVVQNRSRQIDTETDKTTWHAELIGTCRPYSFDPVTSISTEEVLQSEVKVHALEAIPLVEAVILSKSDLTISEESAREEWGKAKSSPQSPVEDAASMSDSMAFDQTVSQQEQIVGFGEGDCSDEATGGDTSIEKADDILGCALPLRDTRVEDQATTENNSRQNADDTLECALPFGDSRVETKDSENPIVDGARIARTTVVQDFVVLGVPLKELEPEGDTAAVQHEDIAAKEGRDDLETIQSQNDDIAAQMAVKSFCSRQYPKSDSVCNVADVVIIELEPNVLEDGKKKLDEDISEAETRSLEGENCNNEIVSLPSDLYRNHGRPANMEFGDALIEDGSETILNGVSCTSQRLVGYQDESQRLEGHVVKREVGASSDSDISEACFDENDLRGIEPGRIVDVKYEFDCQKCEPHSNDDAAGSIVFGEALFEDEKSDADCSSMVTTPRSSDADPDVCISAENAECNSVYSELNFRRLEEDCFRMRMREDNLEIGSNESRNIESDYLVCKGEDSKPVRNDLKLDGPEEVQCKHELMAQFVAKELETPNRNSEHIEVEELPVVNSTRLPVGNYFSLKTSMEAGNGLSGAATAATFHQKGPDRVNVDQGSGGERSVQPVWTWTTKIKRSFNKERHKSFDKSFPVSEAFKSENEVVGQKLLAHNRSVSLFSQAESHERNVSLVISNPLVVPEKIATLPEPVAREKGNSFFGKLRVSVKNMSSPKREKRDDTSAKQRGQAIEKSMLSSVTEVAVNRFRGHEKKFSWPNVFTDRLKSNDKERREASTDKSRKLDEDVRCTQRATSFTDRIQTPEENVSSLAICVWEGDNACPENVTTPRKASSLSGTSMNLFVDRLGGRTRNGWSPGILRSNASESRTKLEEKYVTSTGLGIWEQHQSSPGSVIGVDNASLPCPSMLLKCGASMPGKLSSSLGSEVTAESYSPRERRSNSSGSVSSDSFLDKHISPEKTISSPPIFEWEQDVDCSTAIVRWEEKTYRSTGNSRAFEKSISLPKTSQSWQKCVEVSDRNVAPVLCKSRSLVGYDQARLRRGLDSVKGATALELEVREMYSLLESPKKSEIRITDKLKVPLEEVLSLLVAQDEPLQGSSAIVLRESSSSEETSSSEEEWSSSDEDDEEEQASCTQREIQRLETRTPCRSLRRADLH